MSLGLKERNILLACVILLFLSALWFSKFVKEPFTLPKLESLNGKQSLTDAISDKVAVISASTPVNSDLKICRDGLQECSYAFYLPLTALSWHRLNFSVVVLIAGDDKPWKVNGTHLNHVYNTLTGFGFVDVVFLKTSPDMQTGIAQIGRLFVADLEPYSSSPNTYIIASDADLFPIRNIYDLPKNGAAHVRLTNGFCCDKFTHRGESIGKGYK